MLKILSTYLSQVLQGTGGTYSSKRFVTIISLIALLGTYIANTFFQYPVDKELFDSLMYVVVAGLGITGTEKFAPSTKSAGTE